MTAILTREPPDLDFAKLAIPPGLDRIVRRCLEKTADLRFQSANDLAFALENLTTTSGATSGSTAGAAAIPAASKTRAGAARPCCRGWSRPSRPWRPLTAGGRAVRRPSIAPHFDTFTRITDLAGEETTPSLSPDGTTVAYAVRVNDSWDIYTQRVGGRNATPILNDPQRNESGPAFSPDGSSIAFHESDTNGGIFVAGATGESVRRVTEFGFHPAWSPDGKRIAFTTEEIFDPSRPAGRLDALRGGRRRRTAAKDRRRRRGAALLVAFRRSHRLLEQHRRSARSVHGRRERRRARGADERQRHRLVARVVARRSRGVLLERPWRRDESVAHSRRSRNGQVHGRARAGHDGRAGVVWAAVVFEGRQTAGIPVADRLDQSVRDSDRSRHAQGRRAASARFAHQHSRPEQRLARRIARGVLRHRRAPGGSVRRPAWWAHASRDRRRTARSLAILHGRRQVVAVLFQSRRRLAGVDDRAGRQRPAAGGEVTSGRRVSDPLAARRPDGILRQFRARRVPDDAAGR